MERLTAIAPNGMAYLVKVKPNEQEVESPYPNTLKAIMESFQRLAEYEIAEEQGLLHKAPAANGTKIFTILEKEYDDFFNEIYAPINEETYVHGYTEFVHGEVGKGFFLTKEDAENYIKTLSTTDAP